MTKLRVWANQRPMGWLEQVEGVVTFTYDEQWLSMEGGYELSPWLPLTPIAFQGDEVKKFFSNLLPEGMVLDDVLAAVGLRKGAQLPLLEKIGRELAGVLSLLPDGERPHGMQDYAPITYEEMSRRISQRAENPLLLSEGAARMSIAGAQDKLGIRFNRRSLQISDCKQSSPSTHILKPDNRQQRYRPTVINEYACMKLAKEMKLVVPDVWLLRVPEPAYVVERYDRMIVAGNIVQLHQIDGCQLLNVSEEWKYQTDAQLASLERLSQAFNACRMDAAGRMQFARWVMFNYLIGNGDAHAKNISVLVQEYAYRLAPFYDLLCTKVYGEDGLALWIGDEDRFDNVGRHSWQAFCEDCGFEPDRMLPILTQMAEKLPETWEKVHKRINAEHLLPPDEKELLKSMTGIFKEHSANVLSMMTTID